MGINEDLIALAEKVGALAGVIDNQMIVIQNAIKALASAPAPSPTPDPGWVTLLDLKPGHWTEDTIAFVDKDAPRVPDRITFENSFFWHPDPINNNKNIFVPNKDYLGLGFKPFDLLGGMLRMNIERASVGQMPVINPGGGSHIKFLSSVFTTRGTVHAKYARTTIRMRLAYPGSGLHTSTWQLAVHKGWPPEIDGVEIDPMNALKQFFSAALHLKNAQGYSSGWQEIAGALLTSWFTVQTDWRPDGITYWINGKELGRTDKTTHDAMYNLVSNELYGKDSDWHSGVDKEATTPNYMAVEISDFKIEQREEFVTDETKSPLLTVPEPAPTPTPTPTPEPTPAPIPIPMPPPTNSRAEQIIADMARVNRYKLRNHRNFGWADPSRPGIVVGPHDPRRPLLLPWYTFSEVEGNPVTDGLSLEIRASRVDVLTGGTWAQTHGDDGHSGAYFEQNSDYYNGEISKYVGNRVPLLRNANLHGWWGGRKLAGATDCVIVQLEARLTGPRAHEAQWMLICGVDPYAEDEAAAQGIRSALMFSGGKLVRHEWQTFSAATLSDVGDQEPGGGISAARLKRELSPIPAPAPVPPPEEDLELNWYELWQELTDVRPGGDNHDAWVASYNTFVVDGMESDLRAFLIADMKANGFPIKGEVPVPEPAPTPVPVPVPVPPPSGQYAPVIDDWLEHIHDFIIGPHRWYTRALNQAPLKSPTPELMTVADCYFRMPLIVGLCELYRAVPDERLQRVAWESCVEIMDSARTANGWPTWDAGTLGDVHYNPRAGNIHHDHYEWRTCMGLGVMLWSMMNDGGPHATDANKRRLAEFLNRVLWRKWQRGAIVGITTESFISGNTGIHMAGRYMPAIVALSEYYGPDSGNHTVAGRTTGTYGQFLTSVGTTMRKYLEAQVQNGVVQRVHFRFRGDIEGAGVSDTSHAGDSAYWFAFANRANRKDLAPDALCKAMARGLNEVIWDENGKGFHANTDGTGTVGHRSYSYNMGGWFALIPHDPVNLDKYVTWAQDPLNTATYTTVYEAKLWMYGNLIPMMLKS